MRTDYELLQTRVREAVDLSAAYEIGGGPLGDFCESLHDLVAHVLMWDEINLAVLTEAAAGREHWSLDTRWEQPDVGRMLNRGGVAAGRELPADLLLHRSASIHDAVLDQLTTSWESVGELAQRVWTVPGKPAFWHAAVHLGTL